MLAATLLAFCCSSVLATSPEAPVRLLPGIAGLPDPDHSLAPEEALQRLLSGEGQVLAHDDFVSLGFRQEPLWFLARVHNPREAAVERFLVAGRPHTDHLDLYAFDSRLELLAAHRNGDRIPWSARPFPDNELIFPLRIPAAEELWLLIRMETSGAAEMGLALLDREELVLHKSARQTFAGLYFGAIGAMALFNLLLFAAIRDRSYLLYVCYLLGLSVYLISRNSMGFQFLWPEMPGLNDPLRAVAAFAAEGFAVLFSSVFLRLHERRPGLDRMFRAIGLGLLTAGALSPLFDPALTLRLCTLAVALLAPLMVAAAVARVRDGFKPARFFLLSFAPLALLAPLFVLKTYDIIESNWVLDHAFEIGSALEAWLLSFALAYRLTMLKAENERIQKEANAELEKRVRERTEELNRALNARSEFLAVMSHEIRTPLNGILGTVDMLKDSPMDPDQRRKLHVIEQSGNTLVELINDILDYARIEAGKLRIENEQFNLPGLVRESVALFEHRSRINGDQLRVCFSQDIGALCVGDPIRLRQILVNLVSNAVKFTEGGEVVVQAERDRQNPEYVLFEVRDNGIGISDAQKEHLFELFQQGDGSTRRRYGGTGIGLAICRQLVELMGGEIGVESEHGRGSRFWFRLPLPEVSGEQRRESRRDSVGADVVPQIRLLIVDDNHVNLLVAQGLARKLGHDVEVAESGPEALAVLLNDSRPFDLILMDCEMPDMDGFETAREILRLQNEGKVAEIPIVALTAHAVPDKIRMSHEAGMVSHIAKPINSDKLDREIRAVLKRGAPRPGVEEADLQGVRQVQ